MQLQHRITIAILKHSCLFCVLTVQLYKSMFRSLMRNVAHWVSETDWKTALSYPFFLRRGISINDLSISVQLCICEICIYGKYVELLKRPSLYYSAELERAAATFVTDQQLSVLSVTFRSSNSSGGLRITSEISFRLHKTPYVAYTMTWRICDFSESAW